MKILIIEDNNSVRNVLKMSLESEGYAVDEAQDGESGVYMGKINQYDLILLDIILPKKMGGEVCRELRREGINTPIIMLTSKSDVLTKVELLNSGADDYITKPFSFEELFARIKANLRRPTGLVGEKLEAFNIKLNTVTGNVKIDDEKIYLTRKEFSLLELFMKNRGKILSRAVITEHVWDSNANPFSNTIEAHMRNLRKKIGDEDRVIIVSIPGRGYKMAEGIYQKT